MSDPRSYLIDRFTSDANALRARAMTLREDKSSGTIPGPDASTSESMASACDNIVTMLTQTVESDDRSIVLSDLLHLTSALKQLSITHSRQPAVRAVYDGAAARIREIEAAERNAGESKEG